MGTRIAVPSNDRTTLCRHFGQAREFVVVEVEEGRSAQVEYRARPTAPPPIQLGQPPADSHTTLAQVLADCDVVLAGGMGAPMAAALRQAGLQVVSTDQDDIMLAVMAFLGGAAGTGELTCPPSDGGCGCGCDHEHEHAGHGR